METSNQVIRQTPHSIPYVVGTVNRFYLERVRLTVAGGHGEISDAPVESINGCGHFN
jgi:hypothetical protein